MAQPGRSLVSVLDRIYPSFGLAGSAVIIIGMAVSAASYQGKRGEPYALLNHFVSELGEVGVAASAAAFNAGLIVGGMLLVPFLIGLAASLGTGWAKLGLAAGLIAAVSASLVGVFPMNWRRPHVLVTMIYFCSGLLTLTFYTVAIGRKPRSAEVIDRRVIGIGAMSGLAYAAFLTYMFLTGQGTTQLDPSALPTRTGLLLPALLEWIVLISTLVWFPLVAVSRRVRIR